MPVDRKMMKDMKDRYGKERGEDIYYAVEAKQKKGYAKGGMVKSNCGASTKPNRKAKK